MSMFSTKVWVCLASETELEAARQRLRAYTRAQQYVTDPLWREISVLASDQQIRIHLGNVGEEASRGGYCGIRYDCRDYVLTWDDILDQDALVKQFQRERLDVFKKLDSQLNILREHMRPLRLALEAA